MFIPVDHDKCVHCGHTIDIHFMGMCSNLGMATSICYRCQRNVPTTRVEWDCMTVRWKAWYVIASCIYAAVVGFLGGYSAVGAIAISKGDIMAMESVPDFFGIDFLTGVFAAAPLVIVLQSYRIYASIRRHRYNRGRDPRAFFNLQSCVQLKCLLMLFIPPLIAFLIGPIGTPKP